MFDRRRLRVIIGASTLAFASAPPARAGEGMTVARGILFCQAWNAPLKRYYVSDVFTVDGKQGTLGPACANSCCRNTTCRTQPVAQARCIRMPIDVSAARRKRPDRAMNSGGDVAEQKVADAEEHGGLAEHADEDPAHQLGLVI